MFHQLLSIKKLRREPPSGSKVDPSFIFAFLEKNGFVTARADASLGFVVNSWAAAAWGVFGRQVLAKSGMWGRDGAYLI
jgi:hypothetical protein